MKSQVTTINETVDALSQDYDTKYIDLINKVQETLDKRINDVELKTKNYVDLKVQEVTNTVAQFFDEFFYKKSIQN